MTPQEIAMKFASASATCRNGKCPYTAECDGTSSSCKLKEVAMIIRALLQELATVTSQYKMLMSVSQQMSDYISDLEDINAQYHELVVSFQRGYRPKKQVKRRSPRKTKKGKKQDLVSMDGNEQYAYVDPDKKPDLPVVII